jgi:hypothetical protein
MRQCPSEDWGEVYTNEFIEDRCLPLRSDGFPAERRPIRI